MPARNVRLAGADWPMLMHLMTARGYFRFRSDVAAMARTGTANAYDWQEGNLHPGRAHAYRLLRFARMNFADADRRMASITEHEPAWFREERALRERQAA